MLEQLHKFVSFKDTVHLVKLLSFWHEMVHNILLSLNVCEI